MKSVVKVTSRLLPVNGVCNGVLRRRLGSSVIEEEVRKFGAVGSGWWDAGSKAGTGPLHAMNPVRIEFVRRKLAEARFGAVEAAKISPLEQIKGLQILDVGCGGGLASESLARLGAVVTSVDPSAENIHVASQHSRMDPKTASIRYVHSTIGTADKSLL
jgi:ubiquinone biosynthesis O-methyltransferase